MAACDGLFQEELGAVAWIVTDNFQLRNIATMTLAPAKPDDQCTL